MSKEIVERIIEVHVQVAKAGPGYEWVTLDLRIQAARNLIDWNRWDALERIAASLH